MVTELKPEIFAGEDRPLPGRPLTYEEFLEWADGSFAEWVDGEVVYTSPVSVSHTQISIFLSTLLKFYVEAHDSGDVFVAPFQMKLSRLRRGREPDIMFVAQENLRHLRQNYFDGPADLAVEIISPESVQRDREDKFNEYQSAGVREYWLLDPVSQQAEFYVLQNGQYERAQPDAANIYRSTVLAGFWIDVNWLWQQPLPRLRDVLRQYDEVNG